ncbi:putative proteasome subunit beta type-1 [Astathelohania contejeani]|uniref:Proteasome subunit beta n=1 Tax=Astathelohania contejeani TaxID=164912 RepID=A0ABQ7I177_9MICR|nr:putative proteasome subunit beta type-1 [Thelohania contejeani]
MVEVMTGTTIIAVSYEEGVIIGCDTRTSVGDYVANRLTNKLYKLSDRIYCCRSGSAADTQIVARIISSNLKYHSYIEESLPTVKRVATMGKKLIYKYPQLLAGLIIAGYDEKEGGCIYSINLGGTIVKQEWTIGGSGSRFLYGYCDANWRPNMTKDEKFEFVKKAVSLAISRDSYSGGCIRMAIISKDNVEKFYFPGNEI